MPGYLNPAQNGQRNNIAQTLMGIAQPQPQPNIPQLPMQQMPMPGAGAPPPQGMPQGMPPGPQGMPPPPAGMPAPPQGMPQQSLLQPPGGRPPGM